MHRKLLNKVIVLISVIISFWFLLFYGIKRTSFYGDSLGYYLYLPSALIYHNLDSNDKFPTDKGITQGVLSQMAFQKTPIGKTINQYTYGTALMESPFFFIAHLYEKISGRAANGFSDSYNYMMKLSSLAYCFLGLILVYKILKKYFTETQSLLGAVLTFLCTNLFWFTLCQAGMSHVPLFFLYALLIFLVIKIHTQPKLTLFAAIGFICGLMTLIRPTDIICLLIPALYNVYNKATIKEKVRFIWENRKGILVLAIMFIIPIIPQLFYWKMVSGSYVYYSYGDQHFNWRHPKIINGLFYFSNGWLPYSPVMIFAIIGLILYKPFKKWIWCLLLILPIYIYVIYSWFCYNYINGLGSRPMIHMYPLLSLPLTAFIDLISRQRTVVKSLFCLLILFFVAMNVSYSIQKAEWILVSEESNMAYNMRMMFRTHIYYDDLVAYDINEWQPANPTKLCTLGCNNFDDSLSNQYEKNTLSGSGYVYHVKNEELAKGISIKYDSRFKDAKWFKCSGKFMVPYYPDYFKHLLVIDSKDKFWAACKIENKIGVADGSCKHDIGLEHCEINKWGYVYFYLKIPKGLTDGDIVNLYIWSTGKKDIYMDDLCLELYK